MGLTDVAFSYAPSDPEVVNDGHTIQANVPPGSTIQLDGGTYDPLRFHSHVPGGHTVDGASFAMGLHFVHADAEGKLAVVGVLMRAGAVDTALEPLWADLPGAFRTIIGESSRPVQEHPADALVLDTTAG